MIKKLIALGVAAMLAVPFVSAQSEWGGGGGTVEKSYRVSVGPKVAGNYAMASEKNPNGMKLDVGGSVGFDIGVAGNAHFGRRKASAPGGTGWFGVQVELMYSMRRLTTEADNLTFNNYKIPVLAQIYVLPQLAIEVGPTFTGSFSVSPKNMKLDGTTLSPEKWDGSDVMLTFGASYRLDCGFTIGARYNLGMSEMSKKNFATKISTVEIGLAWMFDVIK